VETCKLSLDNCVVSSSCEISHKLLKIISKFFQILGIINQPILRERWIGISGRRTTLNGQELSTRSCAKLSQAYMYDYYISSVAEKKKKKKKKVCRK
jgi:fructose-1,6-bisphosphatase/inositol monophosphatase family enzyme